jgi:hypothetical protein
MKNLIFSVMCFAGCLTAVQAQTFSLNSFTDPSSLTLAGPASSEIYGVSFGNPSSETTSNGFVFDVYGTVPVTADYSASASGTFLGGGGTSGDTSFDAVLSAADYGTPDPATVVLSGLTLGATYSALFLDADTRSGTDGRSFTVTDNGVYSGPQQYAFSGGTDALGGYILDTFTASSSSETFTIGGAGQLNAVLLTEAPEPTTALLLCSGLLVLAVRFRHKMV